MNIFEAYEVVETNANRVFDPFEALTKPDDPYYVALEMIDQSRRVWKETYETMWFNDRIDYYKQFNWAYNPEQRAQYDFYKKFGYWYK